MEIRGCVLAGAGIRHAIFLGMLINETSLASPTSTSDPAMDGSDSAIDVLQKLKRGDRLSNDDALALYSSSNMNLLARAGSIVRERKNGSNGFYIINRHINYSNICILNCQFCAFAKKRRDPEAYELTIEEMVIRARESLAVGATEIHIVGGLHPTWKFETYLEMLRSLRALSPSLTLKCFTAVEVLHLMWIAKLSLKEVLNQLREAGLSCLTGGGAEIFAQEVRNKICRGKETGEEWLHVHRTAHNLGIRSTATMLFGHIESYHDRVDHLRKLRDLQDETGGFLAFLPLAFQPAHELSHIKRPDEVEILRNIAVCRAYLDNFDHIKAYWISLGLDLARRSLAFGADDLDGTIEEERIYHMAGAKSPISQSVDALREAILAAGLQPVMRDAFYARVA
jgi:aminodeoxyfutalosine synthase